MTTRMNSIIALCAVVFGMIALPVNQTAIAGETNTPPQIHIKAWFIEVPKDGFVIPQLSSNAVTGQMTGILTDPEFRRVLHGLENQKGVEDLAEPECVIASGRRIQMHAIDIVEIMTGFASPETPSEPLIIPQAGTKGKDLGPMVDIVPSILSDGYTIHLEAVASNSELLEHDTTTNAEPAFHLLESGKGSVNLWDGQTLVLGNLKMSSVETNHQTLDKSKFVANGGSERCTKDTKLFIFITARIVDPAGNRVHSGDEIRQLQENAKSDVPRQPKFSSPSR
jgi:hypothetical protein